MATEKNISSRIIHKHDIEANWNKATNFIPKAGEIIVYDKDETYDYERFKIGDGETAVAALPFGSVQSDWDQNDEAAAGYIKNKPMFKINWNGDKTGRETIRVLNSTNSQIYIVKVADCVLFDFGATLEDILAELESGSLKIAAWVNQKLNGILSASQQEQMLQRNSDGTCVGGNIVFEINSESIRVYQDNVNVANLLIVINEDGIWFRHSTHHMTYNDTTIDMEGFVYGVSFDAYPGGETINEMFVSPGVNIQSDWNQNDVSALDYVKNRTHWSEKSIRAVCSGTFEGNYYDIGIDNIQNMPHPGDTCHVVFDSIEYDCVAFDEQIEGAYATCIGNKLYINNSPDGSGEPFVLVLDVENGLAWINCDSGTHTFSIEMIHEEVHQLDPKYIKDMYYEEYVESTITNNINVTLEGTEPVLNPFSIEIIEGDIYTVTWDGATYECTAYIAEGPNTPSIGNGFIANASGGVNEPFFITVYDGDVMLFGSETGTHTISITTMVPEIHTLDNKYLDFIDIQETQIIIPKQEITTKPSTYIGYNYCIDDKSANDFIDGVEYIVTMDEIEYKCIASVFNADDYSFLILGNTNLQHITNFQGHGNGEPFCLYSAFARDGVLYFVTENASTHTIEVRIDGNCKIKESYLPLSQSDWNQSDKTSGTYIKNRPFYTEKGTYIPHETSGSVKNYEIIWTFYPQSYDGLVKVVNDNGLNASDFIGATILKGNAYLDDFIINESDIDESGNIVAIDENRLFVFVKEGSVVTWTNPSGQSYTFNEGIWLPAYTHLNGYFSSSAGIQCKESIIQLDEKFIPDTIARASDLVQPDWDQTDETALDFIKNKPIEETEDDAMEMLFDMGIIIPAVDDGAILTDENGNILVI